MELYNFDRKYKIIHFEDLSILADGERIGDSFEITMSENEIFVIQLAAVFEKDDVITAVTSSGKADICCVNTDITDKFGNERKAQIRVKKNIIQPLFFTVKVSKDGRRKEQAGITIETEREKRTLGLTLNINSAPVKNNGYDDLWRLSRLAWLNSRLAQDEALVKPFTPPEVKGGVYSVLGRDIELLSNGLPKQMYSYFDEGIELKAERQKSLFAKGAEFFIGSGTLPDGKMKIKTFANRIETEAAGEADDYEYKTISVLRYDGQAEYSVVINPKKDFTAGNAGLSLYISRDCCGLMYGFGQRAAKAQDLHFKWDADKQQDCVFIGAVNCGLRVKFKAENYRRPLINIFYKNLPLVVPATTWDNNSNGSVDVTVSDEFAEISASTGKFNFKKGEERRFDFEIHYTPFKPIDYQKAFSVRYSHNCHLKNEYKEIDRAAKNGLNYVIFHQGNMIMPFINYPFYEVDRLKKAVQYADFKGVGVKLYYTEREHSNHMAETFVYKALGDEIILRKQGVSHSWQREKPQWLVDNFGEDIIPGWFVKYRHGKYKNDHDISFIVRPDTRLDNYYIEGLNWLIENIGISGIYIDDTSLDRTTIERAKKLLDKNGGLIDMHMWNHEEPRAGDVSCLNLYCELLPFLDSIWLGEGFFYKKYSPEYMLAEVSGIPYGVTGQMLQDGGDFYLGMLYGMNNRYGWGYENAVEMYKLWDDFGIERSRMLGYWHSENPVKTDNPDVLCTVYKKDGEALACFYNFSKKGVSFSFDIDRELLGFDAREAREVRFGKKAKKIGDIHGEFKLKKRGGIIINLK